MSNWLEAEEQKKLLSDKEISLRIEREEAVHTHLRQFYDLCHRVNAVKYGSLSIDRLKVECKLSHQTKTGSHCSSHTVDERRGIRISCPHQDETFIDVVIKTHTRDAYWGSDFPDNPEFSSDKEKAVIRKTCALQELIDWREDQILHAIQWMLLESEDIKESIPGTEIMTEEAVAEAKAKRLQSETIAAMALEGLREEMAGRKDAITDGWKEVGGLVASLVVVLLVFAVCRYFESQPYDLQHPSFLRVLTAIFWPRVWLLFWLAILLYIVVVLVMVPIHFAKTIVGMARIAKLKSEITSHPASSNERVASIERLERPKKRETGYFLETLRKVRKANRFHSGFTFGETVIAHLQLPGAAVKSILTLPWRIGRRFKGQ